MLNQGSLFDADIVIGNYVMQLELKLTNSKVISENNKMIYMLLLVERLFYLPSNQELINNKVFG